MKTFSCHHFLFFSANFVGLKALAIYAVNGKVTWPTKFPFFWGGGGQKDVDYTSNLSLYFIPFFTYR